ncbi:TcaA 3rd/4th domain-containing protein [Loigolactobacillus bifermentans]|uniref:Uncharacterized protein n=1 Tax=Loigolactobacillus bifermentans DSM 20003 TaxID=1423726 RepID=A0A0R1GP55_9LACO|nr:zinc-ribbon domain-containing protein [Loigolactobacillus bifermentans]KRK32631.1 hypothetical protein FC07_GL002062 [Loigolactobacillus bifermentans DSM 20003]QGG60297.1 zinc ribbon domain-containing protein [Loigolactobacillus bifermentans]
MDRLSQLKLKTHLPATDLGDLGAGEFFCPNCGAPIASNDQECLNCGFDLVAYREHKITIPSATAPVSSQAAPSQPASSATSNRPVSSTATAPSSAAEPVSKAPASSAQSQAKTPAKSEAAAQSSAAPSQVAINSDAMNLLTGISADENPEAIFAKLRAASAKIANEEPHVEPKANADSEAALESRRVAHALDKTKDISDLVDQVRAESDRQQETTSEVAASEAPASDPTTSSAVADTPVSAEATSVATSSAVAQAVSSASAESSVAADSTATEATSEAPTSAEAEADEKVALDKVATVAEPTPAATDEAEPEPTSKAERYFEKKDKTEDEHHRRQHADQPQSKKWVAWVTVGVLVVVVALAFFFGKVHYSRAAQLNRAFDQVATEKPSQVSAAIKSTSSDLAFNPGNSRPFIRYIKANPDYLKQAKKQLKTKRKTSDGTLSFVKTGHNWLFSNYQLEITPIYRTIKTDIPKPSIFLDDQNVTAKKVTQEQKIGPFMPGKYNLKVTGTSNGKKLTHQATTTFLMPAAQTIDLTLKPLSVTLQSNVADATVYINGEQRGTLKNSQLALKDLTWQGKMQVQLRQTLQGKPYKTKTVALTKGQTQQNVTLNFDQFLTQATAQKTLDGFYQLMSKATYSANTHYAQYNNQLAAYFTQGKNAEWYSKFQKFIGQTHMDIANIDHTAFKVKTNQVAATSATQATVSFDVTYTTTYTNGKATRIQTFRYTKAQLQQKNGHVQIVTLGNNEQKISDNGSN